MIFKAKPIEDKLIEEAYREGMQVFNDFWELNWVQNTPNVIVLESREGIDKAYQQKTQDWVQGFAKGNTIYLLDFNKHASDSSHKDLTREKYQAMIRHEIGHLFTKFVTNGQEIPMWLNEGISIFLANQLSYNIKPKVLKGFLDSSQSNHKPAYIEGGHVVSILVNLFGKEKFSRFVRGKGDSQKFKENYGFDLTYENMNSLYHGQEISKNEAIEKIKDIMNIHLDIKVKHDGSIEIKLQDHLLFIEKKWDIWGLGGEFHSSDFVSLRDEEKIKHYLGESKIVGVDIARSCIFSFLFENDIQLAITESNFDSSFYFKLISFKPNEPTIALTSSFKFILLHEDLDSSSKTSMSSAVL